MTREEAIEVISQDIPCEHDKDLIEALDIAIEALRTEPVCEHFYKGYCSRFEDGCFRQCQAEPVKRGEWQEHFDSIHATFEMRCSLCDYRLYIPQTDQFLQTSFCPNCGAKMDRRKEE